MRIDIKEIKKLLAERKRINSIPFREIEWYKYGVKLNIPESTLREFEFSGLSNVSFVDGEFYKHGAIKEIILINNDNREWLRQKRLYLGQMIDRFGIPIERGDVVKTLNNGKYKIDDIVKFAIDYGYYDEEWHNTLEIIEIEQVTE